MKLKDIFETERKDWLNDFGDHMDKKSSNNNKLKRIMRAQENPGAHGIDVDTEDWTDEDWSAWADQ